MSIPRVACVVRDIALRRAATSPARSAPEQPARTTSHLQSVPEGRWHSPPAPILFRGIVFFPAGGFTWRMGNGPDNSLETDLLDRGYCPIAGVDEVGRGPLSGPVMAAAVILDLDRIPPGLNDSKKLTAKRREALAGVIHASAEVSIAEASVAEIDELNILRAAHLAMCRAIDALPRRPAHALIDGNMIPKGLAIPASAIVKGDARSFSIAAASIVAKVARDRVMVDLAQQYPGYGWETNAGYPSPAHLEGLKNHGVTPHHRRSFKPVHNILWQEKTISS